MERGDILRERYRIAEMIGKGGFGETYLAEDLGIPIANKPKCVVKKLIPQSINETTVRFFRKEAEILYRLGNDHPQIPTLKEYFEDEFNFYLIQEFIEGDNLFHELLVDDIWDERKVSVFLVEFLSILDYVHKQNVIHRDIKPENIIRRMADNKLVLIDFGAVKEVGINEGTNMRTVQIGTPGYMPEEQRNGKPCFASDIYAVGMICIRAVTGIQPNNLEYDSSTGERVWRNKAKISPQLADCLHKFTRRDCRARPQDAGEAMQMVIKSLPCFKPTVIPQNELTTIAILRNDDVESTVPNKSESKVTDGRTNKWLWFIVLALFSVGIVLASPFLVKDTNDNQQNNKPSNTDRAF